LVANAFHRGPGEPGLICHLTQRLVPADGGKLMGGTSGIGEPGQGRLTESMKDAVHRQPGGIAPSPELVGEVVAGVALATRTMSSVKFVCALIVTVHST
jgi:hypothetical protein